MLRLDQLALQTGEVRGDELGARGLVGRAEHGADLAERHVEVAQPADHLRVLDLLRAVAAVSRCGVDVGGNKQTEVVIVAQRLHAELRRLGEIADTEGSGHATEYECSRNGRVKTLLATGYPACSRGKPKS